MSKAPKKPDAKKSKDVKGKTVSAEKQQNTTYIEIVPGKFNENDWNNLLEIDESQEFVWDLLDECIENANKQIYQKYLDSQTVPFTINEAKKAILHLIDWQFLEDDTDDDLVESWTQDEEPEACMIDSWAQGYVQTVVLEANDYEKDTIEEVDEQKSGGSFLEELTQEDRYQNYPTQFVESIPISSTQPTDGSKAAESIAARSDKLKAINKELKEQTVTTNRRKQRPMLKKFSEVSANPAMPSSSKPDRSMFSFNDKTASERREAPSHVKLKQVDIEAKKLDDAITKAPNAAQSLLKTLLTRPVGQREVELDPFGDISNMAKLDFDKSHTSGIKTRFVINEKKMDLGDLNSRRSKFTDKNDDIKAVGNLSSRKNQSQKSTRNAKVAEVHEEDSDLILDPVPGVVFTMLNSVRVGPKKTLVPNRQQSLYEKSEIFLKPIKPLEHSEQTFTRMSLEEILESNNEISLVKKNSNNKLKPMPPIVHGIQQH